MENTRLFLNQITRIFKQVAVVLSLFLLCIISQQPIPAVAQESEKPIPLPPVSPPFTHLNTEDGLAHNHVSAIIQDRFGFMWFGTFDGLNRYDGYTFTRYRHDPNSPTSLSSNNISAVLEGPNSYIWVGTEDGGLNRIDPAVNPEIGHIVRYLRDENDSNSLSDNHLESLAFDQDGILWIGTGSGVLNRFDPATETFTQFHPPTIEPEPTPIEAILVDDDGSIWVGSEALFHLDPNTGRFTPYAITPSRQSGGRPPRPGGGSPGDRLLPPQPSQRPGFEPGTPIPSQSVSGLYQDKNGIIWIASNHLYRFDPQTESLAFFVPDFAIPFTEILEDDAGRLWVGSTRGLHIFDPLTEQFERFYLGRPSNTYGFSGIYITSLFKSAEGLVWIGSAEGLNIYNWRHAAFTSFSINDLQDRGRSLLQNVHTMVTGPDGDIWIGGGPRIFRIDRDTEVGTQYETLFEFPPNTDPGMLAVNSLHIDSQRFLWFDTFSGLGRIDTSTGDFEEFQVSDSVFEPVIVMRPDLEGNLWVLTADSLNRFDPQSAENYLIAARSPDNPDRFPQQTVTSLSIDKTGTIWIGGAGFLSAYDPQSDRFTQYSHNPDNPNSMTNGQPTAVYRAPDNIVWITTESGLVSLNEDSATFNRYTESDGLPSSTLLGLLPDENGRLWLSTYKGLSRFDPETETFRNFGRSNGILFDEFISGSYYQAPDGEMFFGGRGGVVAFYPDNISQSAYQPPVFVTQLGLENNLVFPGQENGILSQPIWQTGNLIFNHDQDIISFEFTAFSFAAPEENRYRYRLEGLESSWNEVGSSGRTVHYTTLQPGRYTFRVQGSNNDGLWSDQEVALTITVRPPWWDTIWFRSVTVLILAGLVYGGYRWRVISIKRHNLELEQEVTARTRELADSNQQMLRAKEAAEIANQAKSAFLSSMSHELRTPLNGVLGYAQILKRDPHLTQNQAGGLQVIYESGHHLLTLINDVLDLAKVEAGKLTLVPTEFRLDTFLEGITAVIGMSAQQKDLRFIYETDPNLPACVRVDKKRLRQVLLNLLGNAVKFTEDGQVTFRVKNLTAGKAGQNQVRIRFEVEDTGVGMTPEQEERIFLPFEQAGDNEQRATGTGLGLPISQQLAGLMGGKIEVRSTSGEGSLFWFELTMPVVSLDTVRLEKRPSDKLIAGYEGRRRRILVVDDRWENRLVLQNLLEPLGFEILLAKNGREALDVIKDFAPDLILIDLVMPVMTGFETVQTIRQMQEFQKTPIIVISASVSKMDQNRSRVAGCDAFLPKPIEAGRLMTLVEGLLNLNWIYDTPVEPVAPLDPAKNGESGLLPPLEALEPLHELAMLGKMSQIREYIGRLEAEDSRYFPFTQQIRQMADAFEDKQIASYVMEAIQDSIDVRND